MRPEAMILADLNEAKTLRDRSDLSLRDLWYVRAAQDAVAERVQRLEAELAAVRSIELDIRLTGPAVSDHSVQTRFLAAVLERLQVSFARLLRDRLPAGAAVARSDDSLLVAATAPGSFRVQMRTPGGQLDLMEPPTGALAMAELLGLLGVASRAERDQLVAWSARANEPTLKAFIRLCTTLAGGRGDTTLTWRNPGDGSASVVRLTAERAREAALTLAGEPGREVVTLVGHLEMAQDNPPRIRVTTPADHHTANVPEELLEQVKDLLFSEVVVVISTTMTTSPTTGEPRIFSDLLDISPAP